MPVMEVVTVVEAIQGSKEKTTVYYSNYSYCACHGGGGNSGGSNTMAVRKRQLHIT